MQHIDNPKVFYKPMEDLQMRNKEKWDSIHISSTRNEKIMKFKVNSDLDRRKYSPHFESMITNEHAEDDYC